MVSARFDSWPDSNVAQRIMGSSTIMKSTSNNSNKTTQPVTTNYRFDGSIQIEVSINSIFDKMIQALDPQNSVGNFNLAHAIIGSAVESGKIHYIYNALHGFNNDIEFEIGDIIECSQEEAYEWYNKNEGKSDGEIVYPVEMKSRQVKIGRCKVVGINIYAQSKLTVEWDGPTYYYETVKTQQCEVDHTKCKLLSKGIEA